MEDTITLIAVIFVGLAFGSFATAVSYRIPKGEDFFIKRSYCPKCRQPLSVFDLFPVLSWIFLRGKCRYCKADISSSYLFTELVTASLFLFIYVNMGVTVSSIIIAAFAVCLVVLSIIDFRHYIIPDSINFVALILGILYQINLNAELLHFFIGPVVFLGIALFLRWFIKKWKKKEGLGMGDVKFFVVAGIFLKLELLAIFFFIAGLVGLLTALLWKITGKGDRFPFGPSLAVSLLVLLVVPEINDWWQHYITMWTMGW